MQGPVDRKMLTNIFPNKRYKVIRVMRNVPEITSKILNSIEEIIASHDYCIYKRKDDDYFSVMAYPIVENGSWGIDNTYYMKGECSKISFEDALLKLIIELVKSEDNIKDDIKKLLTSRI